MAEYVDKGKLYDAISDNWSGIKVCVTSDILEFINYTPAADVVEVVRCKDCVRRNQSADLSDSVLCTWLHNLSMPKDGYCSYGESEDKQNETD